MHVACKVLACYLYITYNPLIYHLLNSYICHKCYKSLPSGRNIQVGVVVVGSSSGSSSSSSSSSRILSEIRTSVGQPSTAFDSLLGPVGGCYLDVAVTWQLFIALMAYVIVVVVSDI